MNRIDNRTLQSYLHEIGLEAFLKQLEDVLGQAEEDTSDFDFKDISNRYGRAKWSVHGLRRRLYAPRKTRGEMERFLILVTQMEGILTEEAVTKRVKELDDDALREQYENLSWLFNSKGEL